MDLKSLKPKNGKTLFLYCLVIVSVTYSIIGVFASVFNFAKLYALIFLIVSGIAFIAGIKSYDGLWEVIQ